ncbi:hypothetical protein FD755_023490 [Muntiacus reevesi]|uniref:G-protein coupled receptors family 1 profile domain-containing protein n=1 Tax=Muntiacus reevesi TaxID=9886 RepID=A0A5N3VWZ0_MUNRE|nr:hypothetical protein FD755_023490 [Muntiacus reevesi]
MVQLISVHNYWQNHRSNYVDVCHQENMFIRVTIWLIHSTSRSALCMKLMDGGNRSVMSEFLLQGLTSSWEIQILLFLFFTIFYIASMLGNLLTLLTILSDYHLHSPMYFRVSSIATPNMISDLFRRHKFISLRGCITQMFFIHTVGGVEMVLLIIMDHDRYLAICRPLHYLTIMSLRVCTSLLTVAWTIGLIHSMAQRAFVVKLPFCGPNEMDSFYCDFPRFIKLACTDTYRLQFLVTANSGFICMGTFLILTMSYIFIQVTVHKHSSAIFDVLVTPFVNPIIYTFRNKEMKMAMRRLFGKVLSFRKSSHAQSK